GCLAMAEDLLPRECDWTSTIALSGKRPALDQISRRRSCGMSNRFWVSPPRSRSSMKTRSRSGISLYRTSNSSTSRDRSLERDVHLVGANVGIAAAGYVRIGASALRIDRVGVRPGIAANVRDKGFVPKQIH